MAVDGCKLCQSSVLEEDLAIVCWAAIFTLEGPDSRLCQHHSSDSTLLLACRLSSVSPRAGMLDKPWKQS